MGVPSCVFIAYTAIDSFDSTAMGAVFIFAAVFCIAGGIKAAMDDWAIIISGRLPEPDAAVEEE